MSNDNEAFENPQERTDDFLHKLIQSLVGPEMGGFLEILLSKTIGGAFRNSMPGGGSFAPGGIFTANNVGLSALDAQQRRLEANMNKTLELQYASQREDLIRGAERATGGRSGQGIGMPLELAGAALGSPLLASVGKYGFTGGIAAYAQEQALNHKAFMGGLNYGRRAMGAASMYGLSGSAAVYQGQVNTRVGMIEQAVQTDYINNFEKYAGIGGQRVGQLYAEASRVGAIRSTTSPQAAVQRMQSLARNFDPMKTFFGGDMMAGYDATNTLLGVNGMATFGGQLGSMFSGLRAMSQVGGYQPEYALAMVQRQAQLAAAQGGPQYAAVANASLAGSYMTAIQRGVGLSWVSEAGMRDTVQQRVLGASAGTLNRAIAGAGVQMTEANRNAFQAELRSRGGVLTSSDIANIAQKYGATGHAGDLISRGSSHDARKLIAGGFGTDIAFGSNINAMEGTFRAEARRVLGADFMRNVEGPVTLESLTAAANGNQGVLNRISRLNSSFDSIANRYGYKNADEASKVIQVQKRESARAVLDQMMNRKDLRVKWDRELSSYGKVSGLGGVMKALKAAQEKGAVGEAGKSTLDYIMGLDKDDVDRTVRGLDKSVSALDTMTKGASDAFGMAVYQAVPEMLQSGTVFGKAMTDDQRKLLEKITAAGGDTAQLGKLRSEIEGLAGGASGKDKLNYLSAKHLQSFVRKKDNAPGTLQKYQEEAAALAQISVLEGSKAWKDASKDDADVLKVMERQKQLLKTGLQTTEIEDQLKKMTGYGKYEKAVDTAWKSGELKEYGVTSTLDIGGNILKLLEQLVEYFLNPQNRDKT